MSEWGTDDYSVTVVEAHAERRDQAIAVDSLAKTVAVYLFFLVVMVGIVALAAWGEGTAGRISFYITTGVGTLALAASAAPTFRKWRAGEVLKGINIQLQLESPDDDAGKFGVEHVMAPGDELDILLYIVPREAMQFRAVEVSLEATEIAAGEDEEFGETVSSVECEFEEGRDLSLVEGEEKSFETTLAVPSDAPVSVHRDDRELFWLLTARIEFADGREWCAQEPLLIE